MRNEDDETGPERTCIVTRVAQPLNGLIRFALGPEDSVTPDLKGKLPGRGAWVTGTRAAVAEAVKRRAFARSYRKPVVVREDLPDLVERLLAADVRQALSLANKAGLVISGFAKVEAAAASGRAVALISASDGGEDGKRKLRQAARRGADRDHGPGHEPSVISPLPSSELDLALGRENAIHAALLAGAAGDAFLTRCARLEKYRQADLGVVRPDAEDNPASTGPFALENDRLDRDLQDKELDDRR